MDEDAPPRSADDDDGEKEDDEEEEEEEVVRVAGTPLPVTVATAVAGVMNGGDCGCWLRLCCCCCCCDICD